MWESRYAPRGFEPDLSNRGRVSPLAHNRTLHVGSDLGRFFFVAVTFRFDSSTVADASASETSDSARYDLVEGEPIELLHQGRGLRLERDEPVIVTVAPPPEPKLVSPPPGREPMRTKESAASSTRQTRAATNHGAPRATEHLPAAVLVRRPGSPQGSSSSTTKRP